MSVSSPCTVRVPSVSSPCTVRVPSVSSPCSVCQCVHDDIGSQSCIEYVCKVADFLAAIVSENPPVSIRLLCPCRQCSFLAIDNILASIFADNFEARSAVCGVCQQFRQSLATFRIRSGSSFPTDSAVFPQPIATIGSPAQRSALECAMRRLNRCLPPFFPARYRAHRIRQERCIRQALIECCIERIGTLQGLKRQFGKTAWNVADFWGCFPFGIAVMLANSGRSRRARL